MVLPVFRLRDFDVTTSEFNALIRANVADWLPDFQHTPSDQLRCRMVAAR
jgi:hypothetical protein